MSTFETVVSVGKLSVDNVDNHVDRANIKKMTVLLEKRDHDRKKTIKNLVSKTDTLEERLSQRDARIDVLKAQVFELMRYKESHIREGG